MRKLIYGFFNKRIDFLGLILISLVTILIHHISFGKSLEQGIVLNNTLDFSWQVDSIERMIHGFIAGSDFIFTYGPLYQLLVSIPALVFKVPSFISVIYAQYLLLIIVCSLFYYVTKQFANDKYDHILLLSLSILVIQPFSFLTISDIVRSLLPFLYAYLYVKFFTVNINSSYKILPVLTLPSIFGLYTFDIFILCLILTICLVFYKIWQNITLSKLAILKQYMLTGLIHVLLICFFEVLVSLVLTKSLNYLVYSLDTVNNYQYIMNIPFSINKSTLLYVFPLILILSYIYFINVKRKNKTLVAAVTVATLTALLQLKAALIRSDDGHILLGVYPSIFVLFCVLYIIVKEKKIILLLAIFLYMLLPIKNNFYEDLTIKNINSATVGLYNKTFFDIYKFPKNYYISKKDIIELSPYVKNNSQNVMFYPHDNFILNVYGNTFNSLPLQWYQYSNSIVEKAAIERLKKSPPKYIIMGIDTVSAVVLDDIPNFTRNPLLAKWMLENYTLHKKTNKFLILQYTKNKKASVSKPTCDVYKLSLRGVFPSNLLDGIGKPPTYYLINKDSIRLPYSPSNSEMLIIEDYDNPEYMQKLFEKRINFYSYKLEKKQLTTLKKYAIPLIKHQSQITSPVKCYY